MEHFLKLFERLSAREIPMYLRAANIPVVGGIREGLAAIDRLARYAV
jgi:hypothetical protein